MWSSFPDTKDSSLIYRYIVQHATYSYHTEFPVHASKVSGMAAMDLNMQCLPDAQCPGGQAFPQPCLSPSLYSLAPFVGSAPCRKMLNMIHGTVTCLACNHCSGCTIQSMQPRNTLSDMHLQQRVGDAHLSSLGNRCNCNLEVRKPG